MLSSKNKKALLAADFCRKYGLLFSPDKLVWWQEKNWSYWAQSYSVEKRDCAGLKALLVDYTPDLDAWRSALTLRRAEMVEVYMEDGRLDSSRCLRQALEQGAGDAIVQYLLDCKGVDPSENNCEAVLTAIKLGYTNAVLRMLQDGRVNPSGHENLFLETAVQAGDTEVVGALLKDERVHVTAEQAQAWLGCAASEGRMDIVRLMLLHCAADPSEDNYFAFTMAACEQRWDVVRLILAHPKCKWLVEGQA